MPWPVVRSIPGCKTNALFGMAKKGNKKINFCPPFFVLDKNLKFPTCTKICLANLVACTTSL
jgi:hypothetical protein